MASEEQLTADAIHEKLAADCKDKVDVLVIDVVKGYKSWRANDRDRRRTPVPSTKRPACRCRRRSSDGAREP